MKNIEKKWMLFILATCITVFGVSYALMKNTYAIDEKILDNRR